MDYNNLFISFYPYITIKKDVNFKDLHQVIGSKICVGLWKSCSINEIILNIGQLLNIN